jgi:hypothetical protein
LCWIAARTVEAVASGRSVSASPFSSSTKLYISFSTMSVASPMARRNSAVGSSNGVRRLR